MKNYSSIYPWLSHELSSPHQMDFWQVPVFLWKNKTESSSVGEFHYGHFEPFLNMTRFGLFDKHQKWDFARNESKKVPSIRGVSRHCFTNSEKNLFSITECIWILFLFEKETRWTLITPKRKRRNETRHIKLENLKD